MKKVSLPYSKILLVFLIITAMGLSFAIYQEVTTTSPETVSMDEQPTPAPQNATNNQEGNILNVPPPDAPDEEKRRHFDQVAQQAERSEVLIINNCKPDPLVLETSVDKPITVRNTDSEGHLIIFNTDNTYRIPAESEEQIVISFENGPGLYGYGCDDSRGGVGFFLVTETP